MRYKVWIALIVCGTFLALAPPVSDYLASRQIAQMLVERKDFNSVSLGQPLMSSEYRFGCWALGAAMIGVGTVGGWREHGGYLDDGAI
ncbi:MAG TPA: hypothetical protein VHE81_01790 [Lacipirellulaceae bacterium]|nr:hypothetical protein [Lacipirellulaceae bacterium]